MEVKLIYQILLYHLGLDIFEACIVSEVALVSLNPLQGLRKGRGGVFACSKDNAQI